MIRENKLKYALSLIIIILPSIVALFIKNSIDNMMRGAWYFTWLMPLILAVLHTGLLVLTRYIDPVKQGKKIENMTFFIIPALSIYVGSIFIAIMLGAKLNIGLVCAVLTGLGFIVMGNYIPKAKRNHTFGFKIKWTIANDDNWVATHRLSGKLFVIAGFVMLVAAFLPTVAVFITLAVLLVALCAIPAVYSYNFYKNQIASGAATEEEYRLEKTMGKKGVVAAVISTVCVTLIVCVLMTTGNIKYTFTDSELKIKPTFGGGVELQYSELKEAVIEYREERVSGSRVMGYGSPRLLYGQFRNDEFGSYTRYTYTKSDAAVIIYVGDEVIVISDKTTEDTLRLYETLVEYVNKE